MRTTVRGDDARGHRRYQALLDPARVVTSLLGKRVNHALVDDLERVADARRRIDDVIGA